uniref:DUF148 domain-containing protein n=1 Tax=Caenorhabditis tropicalis TaxID=1561998 RepID=A0A1I7T9M3_9PELO
MCKLFIAVVLLAVATFAAPPAPPSADEVKAQLVSAGLSEKTAAGIVDIGEKYKDQLEAAKGNPDSAKKVFDEIKTKTDEYIKNQPESDQTAYNSYIEKMKKQFEGHSTPSH